MFNFLFKNVPIKTCRFVFVRYYKHYNPKFKWHRSQKMLKLDLPDFHNKKDDPENMTKEEMRSKMKEKGVLPPRYWKERPIFISSTGGVFEPYVPPEGDGKMSFISKTGAKQKYELLEKKSKSMLAIRKIRSFEEDFEASEFVNEAQDIYINAHTILMKNDPEELALYVTERANPEMLNNIKHKTLRWQFIKSLEPPRVVHARCTDVITKENIFAQVTVRFHTQQMLAIYDRFGRLMHGSEILAKDVLEYIVFEKHLSNYYGKWRLHDKIIPDWMPLPEPPRRTYIAMDESKDAESAVPETTQTEVTTAKSDVRPPSESTTPLVT